MGAQMVKEVASKTADVAGDGTTAATVLAQAIYREGAKNDLREPRRDLRRQIAAIELHPFDDVEGGVHGPGFFYRDDAVLAHLLHRFGDDSSDAFVTRIRRDPSHRFLDRASNDLDANLLVANDL
jgi:hypothetical protein